MKHTFENVNKELTAILVDDEAGARDVLENLLRHFCPNVKLLGKFEDLPAAVLGIQKHRPDVVFLDIEMPNYAGHEILDFFDDIEFDIVFVTAYDSYAIKAFEVAALDYLLKPVDIDRLKEAVAKASDRAEKKAISQQYQVLKESLISGSVKNLVIAEKGGRHIVPVSEIVAIEAQESYSFIHTSKKRYTASKNLKHFEDLLEDNRDLFRCHKSWIVNMGMVSNYGSSTGEIDLAGLITAKLSKYKKPEFEALIAKV